MSERKMGHALLSLAVVVFYGEIYYQVYVAADGDFVQSRGTQFVRNGSPFYLNGYNAYWYLYKASVPTERDKVSSSLREASSYGLTVARIWAFSDGGDRPLQVLPGSYNEDVFKGLDFVISEAKKYRILLILSLVNNYPDLGGRRQYVEWARNSGQFVRSDDEFYTNDLLKAYYKSHVQTILTRKNSFTGITYRDDSTIFAWELINEPRCDLDQSGNSLQAWISEMAAYVKSIDGNHLLEIGLEGFYGDSIPEKRQKFNPSGGMFGTDFISNNRVPQIDFATIHVYPDQWLSQSSEEEQHTFLVNWLTTHIEDSNSILRKPLLITEFGKSSRNSSDAAFNTSSRDAFYETIYNATFESAKTGGSCGGALFWQLLEKEMDGMNDGYEVILSESTSTAQIIAQQSRRLLDLNPGNKTFFSIKMRNGR